MAALLAGGLGTWIGVRPTLTVGTFLLLVPLVLLARSPLRALRHMPDRPPPRPAQTAILCRRRSPYGRPQRP